MNCGYCGTELPPGAMFCGECGRSVPSKPPVLRPEIVEPPRETTAPPVVEELVEPGDEDAAAGSEVEAEIAPDVDVEPEPEAEAEPEPETEVEPEPAAEAEPQPELEPDPEPEPEPDLPVAIEADVEPEAIERCTQCGAELSSADIFCGECGFVRQTAARQRDTVSLDPFPWGLPRSIETEQAEPFVDDADLDAQAEPVAAEPVAVEPPADTEAGDFEETRIVDRSGRGERFVLQFSTGESVSVTGSGLLGRNPMAEPGEYFDAMVTITDPGKSVSKTHLEFGQEAGSFWVSDRFSGNGTILREPDRQPRRCDPGKRIRVSRGSRIDIGEQFFIVS